MKTLLVTVVQADNVTDALKVINAQYPYPLFTEENIIQHKLLNTKEEVERVLNKINQCAK